MQVQAVPAAAPSFPPPELSCRKLRHIRRRAPKTSSACPYHGHPKPALKTVSCTPPAPPTSDCPKNTLFRLSSVPGAPRRPKPHLEQG